MGLEEVKNEIAREAQARADVILEEAEARKEEMLEEARQKAEKTVKKAEAEAEQEADALRRKKLSSARMTAKKKRLAAREELLEEAYSQFKDRVQGLDEEKEAELIEKSLATLDEQVDIGTVYARSAHKDAAEEYGDFEERDIQGVIVETADGSRQFDMRFDEIAEQTINDNKKAVSEVLFK